MRLAILAAALALPSSALFAQYLPARHTFNTSIGATSRGAAAARACQLMFRVDAEDYAGWGRQPGTSTTNPLNRDVRGYTFILQDQYALAGGQEQYDFRIYQEGPTPEYPNFLSSDPVGTNQIAHFGPFTSPVGGTAADPRGAWFVTIDFGPTTPVSLAPGLDTFGTVELQTSAALNTAMVPPSWPNDGLSVQIILGTQPGAAFTVFDIRGPGLISSGLTANSYGLVHDVPNSTLAYGGARQGFCDWLVDGVLQGAAVATTNQGSFTVSNAPPGTASFYSGLHPDVGGFQNGGRVDDPGYVIFGAPAGNLVLFAVDFSLEPNHLPLNLFYPGSTGTACLPLSLQLLSFSVAGGSGQDYFQILLTPAARLFATGFPLAWQGFSFNPVTGQLDGAPCGVQHL